MCLRAAIGFLALAAVRPVLAAPQAAAASTVAPAAATSSYYNSDAAAATSAYPSYYVSYDPDQTSYTDYQYQTVNSGTNTQVYYTGDTAAPTVSPSSTPTDPCAYIAEYQASWASSQGFAGLGGAIPLPSDWTWACVQSIKIVQADAIALVNVVRQYVNLQTTLAYLKNPPPSYQQQPVDVMGEFDRITAKIQANGYNLQYDFEQDFASVFIRAHEGHLNCLAGITMSGMVTWTLSDSLVSYSIDGKALPKVYAYSDTLQAIQGTLTWTSSAINSINGMDPVDYIKQLAAVSWTGMIEPHGDWNSIMRDNAFSFDEGEQGPPFNPFAVLPAFQQRKSYSGDSLSITFENGSSVVWPFYGSVSRFLKNVASGSDLYSLALANPTPPGSEAGTSSSTTSSAAASSAVLSSAAATSPSAAAMSSNANMAVRRAVSPTAPTSYPTKSAMPFPNYPQNPVVTQDDFGAGGVVSGYILSDISVGVLVIPSFMADQPPLPSAQTFTKAVQDFISKAQAANVKQVILDVSGNGGGLSLLGYDTFKRFFPNIDPNMASRTRATPQLNTVGKVINGIAANAGGIWTPAEVAASKQAAGGLFSLSFEGNMHLNGTPFTSWGDYFAPHTVYGDSFTTPALWNLTVTETPTTGLDGQNIAGYGNNPLPYSQPPWDASNILLLTDGQCASTCSIFAELMKTHAGVQDLAMGGLPEYGPMQGIGNTRGSNAMEWPQLDKIFGGITASFVDMSDSQRQQAFQVLNITQADLHALPPPLADAHFTVAGGVNFLDELRINATDWPLSMTYEPSRCRLFYTGAMLQDQSQVWRAAAKVLGGDSSMCVDNSVNDTGSLPNCTVNTSPGFGWADFWSNANTTNSLNVKTSCFVSAAAPGNLVNGYTVALIGVVMSVALLGL